MRADPMPDDPIIEMRYGPVLMTASPPPAPRWWMRIGPAVSFARSLAVNLSVIAALGALTALTITELRREPVIIEEISLPPPLVARGYTGAVAAHRLWDAITEIQKASGTVKEQAALTTVGRQLDVVEPGTGLSLQALTSMLRAVFGLRQTRIAGEVICETVACDWPGLRLRLRIFGEDSVDVREIGLMGGHGVRSYFHQAATETMEVIDPYSLAAYYYQDDGGRALAERLATRLATTDHPQRAWAANLLGRQAHSKGDYELAVQWYERSIDFAEIDELEGFAWPWNNKGNSLVALGAYEVAFDMYERAIALDPEDAAPWIGWGVALSSLGQDEDAIAKFTRATEIDPYYSTPSERPQRGLAPPPPTAGAIIVPLAVEIDSSDRVSPWNGWGNSLSRLGRTEEALEIYRVGTEYDPDGTYLWTNWGNSLLDLDRTEEAIEKYRHVTEIDPGYADAWFAWGYCLHKLGQLEEAMELYQKASEVDPEFPWPLNNWGNILGDLGRYEESIDLYRRAVEISPDYAFAWNGWGHALSELGENEEAIEKFQRATEADPTYASAWNSLANSLAGIGRYDDAFASYEVATSLVPTYGNPWYGWGYWLAYVGRNEDAVEKYRRAAEIDPADPDPWNAMGNALARLGRSDESIEMFRRAAEADDTFATPWNGWANRLAALGRSEEAFEKYAEALARDDDYRLAASNWAYRLDQYLGDDPTQRCERAATFGPPFLTTAGPVLGESWQVDRMKETLAECGADWQALGRE